ncbi:MAG TPA: hypothetical protein ENI50_01790 [Euryarchaeota archaeon]|nr:MAG: hypothetical protein DRN45_04995 [Thermococci archaeon]HEC95735.1 hypothetical protein [Euryarchaeota archaeon]
MEKEGVEIVAKLMAVAGRTAPKAHGKDFIVIKILDENEKERLVEGMRETSEKIGFKFLLRDANNVVDSDKVILVGVKGKETANLDCKACGFTCEENKNTLVEGYGFKGPLCAIRLVDLGITIGSMVKVANDLCVDNRVMFSIGVGAINAGLIDTEIAFGIPLSAKGKNIYFDRKHHK